MVQEKAYNAFEQHQTVPPGERLNYHSLEIISNKLARVMTLSKREGKPLIMTLDGMPGLGKTTFVKALTSALASAKKKVAIVHVDDFLAESSVRYAWKKFPDIDPGTNYEANNVRHYKFKRDVLAPLHRDGELHAKRMAYDFKSDADTVTRTDDIDGDTFVIIEGAMATRNTTRALIDLSVHLGGPVSLATEQALLRNSAPGSDKVPKPLDEMLNSIQRYSEGYGEHVANHGTLSSNIVIVARKNPATSMHEVQYAFAAVTPLEKILQDH